ncbi:MAG TPA: hypothetical protein ENK65_02560 [Helicobacteraceae bacterium]|nr:hypothetical protein [Helicobacteraceae bacterium]
MKISLLLLLLSQLLYSSEPNWSLRAATGQASQNDFGEIISGQHTKHKANVGVVGGDLGYCFEPHAFDLPLVFHVYGGLYRFLEGEHQDDFYEGLVYIKVFYNFDFWENRIRIGFAEGVSYAQDIPYIERIEAEANNDNNSYFMNYLDLSIDMDMGRLVGYQPMFDTYVGFAIKHRSGVFGLYNNVRRGGSNYLMVTLEKKF